jgi:TolA-binding protein
MIRWRAVGVLAVLCLACPGGVKAQIVGVVKDAGSHEAVASARVDLISTGGMAAPAQYTDLDGEFVFRVADGDYHLTVRKFGYQDAQIVVSVLMGHAPFVEVDFHIKEDKSDSGGEAGPAEKISAHELQAPQKARDDYGKGKDLLDKKDYSGAIADFQKAIDEYPDFYEAYAKMGVAQYMAAQGEQARQSLQKSIDLSAAKYPEALFDMADLLVDIGDYSDAEPLAEQVITLQQSSWRGYFEKARALLGMKKYPEAEQSAQKCLELNAQYKDAYVVLTNIHIGMHEYPEVLKDIDAYLKLDSTSPASEQMRATRAQVAKAIASGQSKPNH